MVHFKDDAEALAACAAGRDIEIVRNYPGHAEGVRHGKGCPHFKTTRAGEDKALTPECVEHGSGAPWGDCCALVSPLYMETTHVGKVLSTGERNGYHDSDFTAKVWTEAGPVEMVYASTRGWSYPNSATPDADAETKAAYGAWVDARNAEAAIRRAAEAERLAEVKALEPVKGATVEVFKGRKVAKGTVGVVIWAGEGNYGPRIGIKDADEVVHWTAATNARAIIEDRDEGETWLEYGTRKANEAYEAKKARREAAEDAAPEKGATVRVTRGPNEGEVGTIFWSRNGRLGIAREGAKKRGRGYADEDVIWTFGDAVTPC
jgi:hypothetical protein